MKITKRKARCKHVLAIVGHKVEKFEMIREESIPPQGDFAEMPWEVAVLRMPGATGKHKKFEPEVRIGLDNVIFLHE